MPYVNFINDIDKNIKLSTETYSFNDYFKINKLTENIDYNVETLNDFINLIDCREFETLQCIKEPLMELSNMIGLESIKNNIIEQILYYYQNLHNENDYLHTIISGPPGTGKTELAKLIGKIFSNLGILKNKTFKKVTRSDLIAGYLGQTTLKTRNVINESLGGVLFIDEVYALGNKDKTDTFSKECIDTLCDALSDHKNELMVIIAGYENDIDQCFFSYNEGLKSRFIWKYSIEKYTSKELFNIFINKIVKDKWTYCKKTINVEWFNSKEENFKYLGRDIEQLISKIKICHAKRIFGNDGEIKKKILLEDLNNGYKRFISTFHSKDEDKGYLKMYT